MDPQKAFGSNVRRIRKARGHSQEKLGEIAGLHRTYIGSIERGEQNVSLQNIVAIAIALRVPVSDLVAGLPEDPVTTPAPTTRQDESDK
ncbi:helix-turn-helix transcriptional regulator [Candidatus Poribacteria bacterium]|jgi:transcriptional regulator with XRE-family HTH domain|nr:helix-turn-helix transcriptional regulator [Candidatus Poribacteria bacterium]MBT5536179.1 helix-turn-helix transcriptional regulator [Candidatus Poribacteria bacterium]MBT7097432.1 helix-turn-helix transcriptional regulator [Candidatus Poribacteria bacterium]